MRVLRTFIAICAAGCLLQTARGEAAFLVLRTDLECRLKVDGEPKGALKPGAEIRVSVASGEHRVAAEPVAGGAAWETVIALQTGTQELAIPLRAHTERAAAKQRGYWLDPQTQFLWPAADNGVGVSAAQAAYYCRTLKLGGYSDWTLPTIDELHALFGGVANESGHHVRGPIRLTGWQWSASPGQEPGQQWALDFGDGARASAVTGDSGFNRALCVRRPSTKP
jgi:hypothetical protein